MRFLPAQEHRTILRTENNRVLVKIPRLWDAGQSRAEMRRASCGGGLSHDRFLQPILQSHYHDYNLQGGLFPIRESASVCPAELTDVDPAWKSCQPLWYGAFDPPRILTKVGQLGPPAIGSGAVTSVGPIVQALPATVQATPTPATPASTPAKATPTTQPPQQDPSIPPPQNSPAKVSPPQAPQVAPPQAAPPAPPPQAAPPQSPQQAASPAPSPVPPPSPPSPPPHGVQSPQDSAPKAPLPQAPPPTQPGKFQPSPALPVSSANQQPASSTANPPKSEPAAVASPKTAQTEPSSLLLDPGSGNLVQGGPPSHSASPAAPVVQQSPQNTGVPPNIDPPLLASPKPVQNPPEPLFVDPGNGNLLQIKPSSTSTSSGSSGSQPAPQVPADALGSKPPLQKDQKSPESSPSPLFFNPSNGQIVPGNTPRPPVPSEGLGNQQVPQGSASPPAISLLPSVAPNTPSPLFLDPGNGNIVQGNPPTSPMRSTAAFNAPPPPAGSTLPSVSSEALPPLSVDGKSVPVKKLPGGEINVAGTILTPQAPEPKYAGLVSAGSNLVSDGSSQVAPKASDIGTYILQGINGDTTRVDAAITAGVAGTPTKAPVGGSSHDPPSAVNPIVIGGTTYVPPVTAAPTALNTPTPPSVGTVLGHIVAEGSSNVLLDGTAYAIIPATMDPLPALSVGSHAIQQA